MPSSKTPTAINSSCPRERRTRIVPSVFDKLNLRDQTQLLVLNAPESFEAELNKLRGRRILRGLKDCRQVEFALIFVSRQKELNHLAATVTLRAADDPLLWFAYPKGTSRKYSCDFSRDHGWDVLQQAGFDTVRQVAIDADWSALRFRRAKYINRKPVRADQARGG
jgi:hypothetical protein